MGSEEGPTPQPDLKKAYIRNAQGGTTERSKVCPVHHTLDTFSRLCAFSFVRFVSRPSDVYYFLSCMLILVASKNQYPPPWFLPLCVCVFFIVGLVGRMCPPNKALLAFGTL